MALKLYEKNFGKSLNWHKIPNYNLQVTNIGFTFGPHNFFFEIIDKITQQLTSAGLIDHFIEFCFPKAKHEDFFRHWSVLKLENLEFGFIIWLGCCGICGGCFVVEIIANLARKSIQNSRETEKLPKKIKFAKVHPMCMTSTLKKY